MGYINEEMIKAYGSLYFDTLEDETDKWLRDNDKYYASPNKTIDDMDYLTPNQIKYRLKQKNNKEVFFEDNEDLDRKMFKASSNGRKIIRKNIEWGD